MAAQFVVLCVVGLYKNIPLRGEIGLYLFSTVLFMLAAVAFGVMLGSFTRRLACFAQLYMMCSNLIIFTSRAYFPVLSDAQMAQHCIQDIFAYCQYCRGTEGCEPEGNRLGRCLAPAGGNRPVYRVLAGGRRRHVRSEH